MRAITKGPEPGSLTAHRQRPHSDYANYQEKEDLRRALVTEQRGLCCYCMGRIKLERATMKIEHWRCQARYPDRQLDYRNLLATCHGRVGGADGQSAHLHHCDTKKGDSDLEWNPADPAHHIDTRIRYEPTGAVRSDEATFDDQLTDVLNLNLPVLRNNRKAVYDGVLGWWLEHRSRNRGRVLRERLERERAKYDAGVGELTPYAQVAIWLLNQKLE